MFLPDDLWEGNDPQQTEEKSRKGGSRPNIWPLGEPGLRRYLSTIISLLLPVNEASIIITAIITNIPSVNQSTISCYADSVAQVYEP
ncbi:hypothetical protein PROFUN_07490 [Planoprotostelium fungivorum]|uniref:Uncharacterized protein n=1 Tax=Planoprotostelium fungivorum TaxID=1890364 RepID=A0A2P6NLJ9_9EUKA|nr:hypothetical protein PROFUN_07490 [Planoprotostelium fungivorum]